ncbi:MAG: putative rane protein [Ilumatobacteraceae bacterium]|nr:putative rane protein [Ilumatobacteraceae bacterium]
MNNWLWYVTRSTGIVATVLMLASLAWGFLFSSRETGTRLRPAWWLDMHRGLGGLALVFTAVHVVAAFADPDLGVDLATVFVPGAAQSQTTAFTWGVVAFYGLVVVVFTSWPKMLFRRRTWRTVHLLSVPATALACVHAYQLGSDAHTPAFNVLMPLAVGGAVYPFGLRVWGLALARSQEAPRKT